MFPQLAPVFGSFHKRNARYLVIGGVAAIYYGVNRLTNDLDVLIDPELENARAILAGLEEARFGTAALITAEDLVKTDVTILKDRVRIDIFTHIPGVVFTEAWERRQMFDYEGVPVNMIAKADLLAAKRAAGRQIDLDDIRRLEAAAGS